MEPEINDILSPNGLNSIAFSDSYAKLCFTTMLVKSIISRVTSQQHPAQNRSKNKKIIYVDTDTQFAAYLKAGFLLRQEIEEKRQELLRNNSIEFSNSGEASIRLIDIYLPSEGRFESILGNVISSMPEACIVIFDSLNSFYNLYPTRTPDSEQGAGRQLRTPSQKEMELSERGNQGDGQPSSLKDRLSRTEPTLNEPKVGHSISRLNHLLSIFIMLLVKHGVYHNIPVIVTSMVRYKKVSDGLWTKSPACRRLLNQKSFVRMSVEMSGEKDLSVNIMKHPYIAQQTIVYPNAEISLSPEVNQSNVG